MDDCKISLEARSCSLQIRVAVYKSFDSNKTLGHNLGSGTRNGKSARGEQGGSSVHRRVERWEVHGDIWLEMTGRVVGRSHMKASMFRVSCRSFVVLFVSA